MERPDAGIAAPGEHELLRRPDADQLVVDHVRRHADEREVPASLADDFVARGERNQVGKAFECDDVPVPDKLPNCLGQLHDCSQNPVIVP